MTDPEARPGAGMEEWHRRAEAKRLARDPLSERTRYERGLLRGLHGEQELGRRLNEAARANGAITVLHDLAFRGRRGGNVDHIVVGPAGVTVLDAKSWRGKVTVNKGTLWRGRRPKTDAVTGMLRQMAAIKAALIDAHQGEVPVRGVLCFVEENPGLAGRDVQYLDGVGISTINPALKLATEPGSLQPFELKRVHAAIKSRFVVRGGEIMPATATSAPSPGEPPLTVADILAAKPPRRRIAVPAKRRMLAIGAAMTALLVLVVVAIALIGAGVAQTHWLTRTELRTQQPQLRAIARARAHGRVHGPRVSKTSSAFVLRYRHGKRCRVRITVSRLPRALGRPAPAVTSAGCHR